MVSRMDKYRHDDLVARRSKRNEDLYNDMYEDVTYTGLEAEQLSPVTNRIDIDKIREMLKSNVDDTQSRIVKTKSRIDFDKFEIPEEDKNYDIRDVLSKAKEERLDEEGNYRRLRNTEYDILKGIKIKNDKRSFEEEEKELKDLIHTVTSMSALNKPSDGDLLEDLKSNTMIGDSKSIKALLEEAKAENKEENEMEIDKSFYTSSLDFTKEDFERIKNIDDAVMKNNKLMKILLAIIIGLMVIATIYVIISFI